MTAAAGLGLATHGSGGAASPPGRLHLPALLQGVPRPDIAPPGVTASPTLGATPSATASSTVPPSPPPEGSPPPTPTPGPIRRVGEVGGASWSVAVLRRTAYLGEGHRLVIVDIADPAHPRRLGQHGPFPDLVRDLVVDRGHLYLAAGAGGLRVFDLTGPAAPREVGAFDTPGQARGVVISGHLAFIADGPGGLQVVDIAEAASPRLVGALDTIQPANAVALQGPHAYLAVADARSAALLTVDVSNPAQPRELDAMALPGTAVGVAVERGYAYVADGDAGLHLLSLADPARPRSFATLAGPARALLLHGGYVYVAADKDSPQGGIWVADLGLRFAPRVLGAFRSNGQVADMTFADGLIWVAQDNGLVAFAVDAFGTGRKGGLYPPGYKAESVAAIGGIAYGSSGDFLLAWDVSEPGQARMLGRLALPSPARQGLAVEGGYAYVSHNSRNLAIVDITDPTSLRTVGQLNGLGSITDLATSGSHVYLVDGNQCQLMVVDVAQPRAPRKVGGVKIVGCVESVAVTDTLAFVTSMAPGRLYAVDITEPDRPSIAGSLAISEGLQGLTVAGSLAYVTDSGRSRGETGFVEDRAGSLRVIDVSDPAQMRQIGQLDLPPGTQHVAVAGDRAYLANGESGFLVADISDPSAPRLLAGLDTPGMARAVAVGGDHAFVADGSGGLHIFRVDR